MGGCLFKSGEKYWLLSFRHSQETKSLLDLLKSEMHDSISRCFFFPLVGKTNETQVLIEHSKESTERNGKY